MSRARWRAGRWCLAIATVNRDAARCGRGPAAASRTARRTARPPLAWAVVAVISGGTVGHTIAPHLAAAGGGDVVVLEGDRLSSCSPRPPGSARVRRSGR